MKKHTPGPWKVASTIEGDEYSLNVLGGRYNGLLAQSKLSVHFDSEEAEANAKLISAAPELLEALEKCIKYSSKDPQLVRDIAAQAIAKATSKNQ